MFNRNLQDITLVSIYALLRFGKRVNHGGEYRLEISANFQFYGPEKSINLT